MKTPDIPQECGLYSWNGGIVTDDPKIGAHAFRVSFDTRSEIGRAALAAYCMAVIDEMIWDFQRACWHRWCANSFDMYSLMEYEMFLFNWRAEWSRYGGFTQ